MTGVSTIEFGITVSNTGMKNGACTFIENSLLRISLGGLPPSRHGASTCCCLQHLILVCWRASCSGASSKPGQVLTRPHMKCLLPTCLIVTYRLFEKKWCNSARQLWKGCIKETTTKNSCT